jgi:cytochrome c-type biogenesis protein CcmH/NrfG
VRWPAAPGNTNKRSALRQLSLTAIFSVWLVYRFAGIGADMRPGDEHEAAVSSRYAKPSKPPKRSRPKLSRIQVISIIFTVAIVCVLISGITGSIIVDALNDNGDDSADTGQTTDDLLPQLQKDATDNPNDAATQAALANYLANTGQFDQAVPYYEKALQLTPDDWALRLDFAQALMDNGKLSDSELQFDTILDTQPQNAQAWYYLAELYQKFTPPRTDEAIYAYQQVMRFDPGSFIATQAVDRLAALGVAASPVASPATSPEAQP